MGSRAPTFSPVSKLERCHGVERSFILPQICRKCFTRYLPAENTPERETDWHIEKAGSVKPEDPHSPTPWKLERIGYDPDVRSRELRDRFARITNKSIPSKRWSNWWKSFGKPLSVGSLSGIVCGSLFLLSPWPPLTTLKHIASGLNCDAARAVGLAPSLVGQPGYWGRHDRDNDGIACELYFDN